MNSKKMIGSNVLIFSQKDAMIEGLLANGMTQEYIDSIFASVHRIDR